jgi:hypothetical protein
MNARSSPDPAAISYFKADSAEKDTPPLGLKMPDLRSYDKGAGKSSAMFKRLVLIFSVIAIGAALSGCTKCGPIWDDWLHSPKSCKSDGL